jgi:hypothetical protein
MSYSVNLVSPAGKLLVSELIGLKVYSPADKVCKLCIFSQSRTGKKTSNFFFYVELVS